MNISSVTNHSIGLNYNSKKVDNKVFKKDSYQQNIATSSPFLSSNYYLSFKGGYSLNLLQTMRNFEEVETQNGKQIVPDKVREVSDFVLDAGNPNNLTLIDVHKKAYEDIEASDSLEEVKVLHPEFEDVLSVDEVNARKDSFIADVKAGKCEIFSKDEDLSLQLLKLYWANGFSLSDLEKYTNGKKNIAYVMQKLNIPRLDSHYGHILKFSDKEYNERMAEELALKRAEFYEIKNGHVYIPRGPLPKEQREKISVSLIDYYANNPERIYLQSARQKEFYKNHPEEAELFALVVEEAWRLGSSKPVKDMLSKFLTRKGIAQRNSQKNNPQKSVASPEDMSIRQRLYMQEFWATHPQAKDKFSLSMKYAWKRIKELKEIESTKVDTTIPAYPKHIQDNMRKWAEKKGYNPSAINFNLTTFIGDSRHIQASKGAQIVKEYFEENPVMADVYADSIAYSLAVLRDYLLTPDHKSAIGDKIVSNIEGNLRGKKSMGTKELLAIYVDVVKTLISNNRLEDLAALCRYLEQCYNHVINIRKREGYPTP